MITIFELSRDVYTEILRVMPRAIRSTEQDYETVTVVLNPSTDIDTDCTLQYVTLKWCTKFIHISFRDFHYITVS